MTNFKEANNFGQLLGRVASEPQLSHQFEGEKFYEFNLEVARLSQTVDVIPVTVSERIIKANDIVLKEGNDVAINGEFRSYNKVVDGKSRLMLHFFVHEFVKEEELVGAASMCDFMGNYASQNYQDGANHNIIKLEGYICKQPLGRVTPFNKEICDVLLAINRTKHSNRALCKSDYIPCIMWGRNARFVEKLNVGSKIKLIGRIQSRDYNKVLPDGKIEIRTAYEVSCQALAIMEKEGDAQILKVEEENIG